MATFKRFHTRYIQRSLHAARLSSHPLSRPTATMLCVVKYRMWSEADSLTISLFQTFDIRLVLKEGKTVHGVQEQKWNLCEQWKVICRYVWIKCSTIAVVIGAGSETLRNMSVTVGPKIQLDSSKVKRPISGMAHWNCGYFNKQFLRTLLILEHYILKWGDPDCDTETAVSHSGVFSQSSQPSFHAAVRWKKSPAGV